MNIGLDYCIVLSLQGRDSCSYKVSVLCSVLTTEKGSIFHVYDIM